jgi:hypothetical protein
MDRDMFRWVAGCATAEAVGMTAAAAAARGGDAIGGTAAVATLAVAGGVVEALAVGVATAAGLRVAAPSLSRVRWTAATTVVAGLCWGVGSLPAALSADGEPAAAGPSPAAWLVAAGAIGVGVATGAVLGAAQSALLRGHVRHPWRWTTASTLAWPLPMAVIFLGAGTPDAGWATWQVLALAAPTGLLAGALLGAVLGVCASSLNGTPVSGRAVLRLLRSPVRGAAPGLVGLAVPGRRTGATFELPVATAEDAAGLVVHVGHPARKTWWRNVIGPTPVRLLQDGEWHDAEARVVTPDDPAHPYAAQTYGRRFPRSTPGEDAVLVRIHRTTTTGRIRTAARGRARRRSTSPGGRSGSRPSTTSSSPR